MTDKKVRSRRARQRKIRRILTTVCLMALVMVVSVGATMAYLTAKTAPVVNTFTPAGIAITLTETPNQADGSWKAQLVPGKEYAKDPVVAVDGTTTDVDVYLFVKFDEATSKTYLDYTSNLGKDGEGWTLVTGRTDVWYREVKTDAAVKSWHLLDGDKVTVKNTLSKEQTNATSTMTYTAYAIQTEGFDDADDAWAEVSKLG